MSQSSPQPKVGDQHLVEKTLTTTDEKVVQDQKTRDRIEGEKARLIRNAALRKQERAKPVVTGVYKNVSQSESVKFEKKSKSEVEKSSKRSNLWK